MRKLHYIAMALLLASCSTVQEMQGVQLDEEIQPLGAQTAYYESDGISLPAARKFARDRRAAFYAISNRESRIKSGSSVVALGALLSGLGLSVNNAGSTELFSILGLTNAAAQGGTALYTNRLRQMLLDEGALTLTCLISATNAYYVKPDEVERLFGAADPDAEKRERVTELRDLGFNDDEIENRTKDIPRNIGLQGEFRAALRDVQRARNNAAQQRDLADPNTKNRIKEKLAATVTEAGVAIGAAQSDAIKLAAYRAGIESAGAGLHARTETLIGKMTIDMRPLEPDPEKAAAAYAKIKSGFGASLESLKAADIRKILDEVAEPGGEVKNVAGRIGLNERQLALVDLINSLAILDDVARRIANELAIIDRKKSVSGDSDECKDPTVGDTLIVSPPNASQVLAAGASTTLTITSGGGVKPTASAVNDAGKILTFEGPTADASATGQYDVKITAKKDVKTNTNITVVIGRTNPSRSVAIAFQVTAAKKPTLTLDPKTETEVAVGGTTELTVNVSDGSSPTVKHKTDTDKQFVTIGAAKKKAGSDKDFEIEFKGVKAKPDGVAVTVTAGVPEATADLTVKVTPAAAPEALSSAPKGPEKVKALVEFLQTYLNEHYKGDDAALKVDGLFTPATSERFKKLQAVAANNIASKEGRIDEKTFEFIRDKIIEKNNAEIVSSWAANKEKGQKALAKLAKEYPAFVNSIDNDNNTLSANERKLVWLFQYSLHKDNSAPAGIKLNGALDTPTLTAILGSS